MASRPTIPASGTPASARAAKDDSPRDPARRALLARAGAGLGWLALGPSLLSLSRPVLADFSAGDLGPLGAPDGNGLRLPAGFTSRVIARSATRVERGFFDTTDYTWHIFPDGGATFPTPDGGWVYVSNSETPSFLGGGVGAIRFDASGGIRDAYRILGDTNVNCAGGPTPWGTWLSCEEFDFGRVWECDPLGERPAVVRPALGTFTHEAVAVDPLYGNLYMTEDEGDGRLYRFVPDAFTPEGWPVLEGGTLQVARVDWATGFVSWLPVPERNPDLLGTPTREQVPDSTPFRGGEGIWYHRGLVYFTTKGDNRIWALNTHSQFLALAYDAATAPDPVLTGVDNVTVSATGQILVAEDGGDMQIVLIDQQGGVAPLLQVTGQDGSEITGPAFDPSGERLYFSSQRGSWLFGGGSGLGITYEVRGPFPELFGA